MRQLLRLWPYVRRYRAAYAAGLGLVTLGSLLAVATPYIIKAAVDLLGKGGGQGAAVLGGLVSSAPGKGGSPRTVALFALALACAGMARALMNFRGRFSIIAASRKVEYDLRSDIYRKLTRLPARFFDTHASGDVHSRVINDVEGVRMMAGVSVMIGASGSILLVLSLAAMFSLAPRLAALAAAPLALVGCVIAVLSGREFRQSEKVQARLADISTLAQENFSGARVIRAFCREAAENRKFSRASAAYRRTYLGLSALEAVAWAAMPILVEAGVGATLLAGGLGIIRGTFTYGDFVAFTAFQFMLSWPVMVMGWAIAIIQRGGACMHRLCEILDAEEEESAALRLAGTYDGATGPGGPKGPPDVAPGTARIGTARAAPRIEFRGLSFRYADDRAPALSGISLTIEPGERVAVVGRTGSGKSTLVQLLLGLYRAPDGAIFLDGEDINRVPRARLRSAIGCVPQDTFLFSDTVAANIAFGREGDAPREDVLRAAEDSRLSEDLRTFPDGIDQVVGERGITLSGGQKQRTAIARALARDPRVLILDDALSSVDVHTEREILGRLGALFAGRTCLVVTHRFSSLSLVGRILVLDEGRLREEGTHEELLARGGLYAELLARQRLEEALEKE